MEAIRISDLIQVSDYYQRLTELNQDAEIALRCIMSRMDFDKLAQALKTRKRFNHKHNHNHMTGIFKKEDWYFEFMDSYTPFDSTLFSLSELPLESKLILIDILQKL